MTDRIAPPAFGEEMAPTQPSEAARRFLALRRSASADLLGDPGPDSATLDAILEIAARAPDHRKMVPFRFIVFEGEGRARAGRALTDAFAHANPGADEKLVAAERGRFMRAPVVVSVVARIDHAHRTPAWEQELCCGAVCYNLLLAVNAYGFSGNWLTEWCAYDSRVAAALGLGPHERIAGFIYLGTARESPRERQRPVMADIVTRWA
jgi:nitroreductase